MPKGCVVGRSPLHSLVDIIYIVESVLRRCHALFASILGRFFTDRRPRAFVKSVT
jgi:hypothetical protein